MDYVSIIGIAIGLAMDAFAVSLTSGAVAEKLKPSYTLKIAFCFGSFQFIMPMIGWGIGKAGENLLEAIDHWIAFFLLGYIGIKMIYDSVKNKENDKNQKRSLDFKTLILLAVATSIDALATGVILPSAVRASNLNLMLLSALIIGVITFILCFVGVYIGKKFGNIVSKKAEIFGGIILIIMGCKILIEHMFFA